MIIWLASYPRSGNTFLRVVLNNAFGYESSSVHGDTKDIAVDPGTKSVVGHSELSPGHSLGEMRASDQLYFVKTHHVYDRSIVDPADKVIYLYRDGRESTWSYYNYIKSYSKLNFSLRDVILGRTFFGTWGAHISSWSQAEEDVPIEYLKFEDITQNPDEAINAVSRFCEIEPKTRKLPTFDELSSINSVFFRSGQTASWREHLSPRDQVLFLMVNEEELTRLGYLDSDNDKFDIESEDYFSTMLKQQIALGSGQGMTKNVLDSIKLYTLPKIVNSLDRIEKQSNRMNSENEKLFTDYKVLHSHATTITNLNESARKISNWRNPIGKLKALKKLFEATTNLATRDKG